MDVSEGPKQRRAGSAFWMAPEIILRKPHSFPADIWSLGMVILEVANRHVPDSTSNLKVACTHVSFY